jgi:hypothetical protein
MTLTGNDILSPEWVRHQLEGGYIAQHRANTTQSWGSLPLIRLLLANPGSHLNQWEPVVDALLGLPGTDRLVAVTGIGLSLETARAAIQRLSDHRIPVVASPLAADEFSEIPGFLRVSPTSSTYSMAAAGYVKPAAHTATIVQDDNNADLYPKTLATAFTQRFADADHRITGERRHPRARRRAHRGVGDPPDPGGRALPGDRAGRAPGEEPAVRHPRRPGRERHDLLRRARRPGEQGGADPAGPAGRHPGVRAALDSALLSSAVLYSGAGSLGAGAARCSAADHCRRNRSASWAGEPGSAV